MKIDQAIDATDTNCCGQPRLTKFCPECGRPLKGTPDGLLQHIRGHAKSIESRIESVRATPIAHPDHGWAIKRREQYLGRLAKSLTKWQEWERWVANQLSKEGKNP